MSQFRDNSWLANARSYGVLKSLRCSARFAKSKSKSAVNLSTQSKQEQKKQKLQQLEQQQQQQQQLEQQQQQQQQRQQEEAVYANVDEVLQATETEEDALMGNAQVSRMMNHLRVHKFKFGGKDNTATAEIPTSVADNNNSINNNNNNHNGNNNNNNGKGFLTRIKRYSVLGNKLSRRHLGSMTLPGTGSGAAKERCGSPSKLATGSYNMTGSNSEDHRLEIGAPILISTTTLDTDRFGVTEARLKQIGGGIAKTSSIVRTLTPRSSDEEEFVDACGTPQAEQPPPELADVEPEQFATPTHQPEPVEPVDPVEPVGQLPALEPPMRRPRIARQQQSQSVQNLHRSELKVYLHKSPSMTLDLNATAPPQLNLPELPELYGASELSLADTSSGNKENLLTSSPKNAATANSEPGTPLVCGYLAQQQRFKSIDSFQLLPSTQSSKLSLASCRSSRQSRPSRHTRSRSRSHSRSQSRSRSRSRSQLSCDQDEDEFDYDLKSVSYQSLNAQNLFVSIDELQEITRQINETEDFNREIDLEYCTHRDQLRPSERRITLLKNKNQRLINFNHNKEKLRKGWHGMKHWLGEEGHRLKEAVRQQTPLKRVAQSKTNLNQSLGTASRQSASPDRSRDHERDMTASCEDVTERTDRTDRTEYDPSMSQHASEDDLSPHAKRFKDEGQNGFEELRRYVKQGGDFSKELIFVLQERADSELIYSKSLSKLANKLNKAGREIPGSVADAWRGVATEMESRSDIHRQLAASLTDELVKPLKTVVDNHHKTRKVVESNVDKAARVLSEWRVSEAKAKKASHTAARENEKLQDAMLDVRIQKSPSIALLHQGPNKLAAEKELKSAEKDCVKLDNKRKKAEEAVKRADVEYYTLCVRAERARVDWEMAVLRGSSQLQSSEQQRLGNMHNFVQQYARLIADMNPILGSLTSQLQPQLEACNVAKDVQVVRNIRRNSEGPSEQLLPDFYCEHTTLAMNRERRKHSLIKLLQLVKTDLERERRSRDGLRGLSQSLNNQEHQNITDKLYHIRSMLTYLEGARLKLHSALLELDHKPRTTHPLAQHIQITRDRTGLQQSILKVPNWLKNNEKTPHSNNTLLSQHDVSDDATTADDVDDDYSQLPSQTNSSCANISVVAAPTTGGGGGGGGVGLLKHFNRSKSNIETFTSQPKIISTTNASLAAATTTTTSKSKTLSAAQSAAGAAAGDRGQADGGSNQQDSDFDEFSSQDEDEAEPPQQLQQQQHFYQNAQEVQSSSMSSQGTNGSLSKDAAVSVAVLGRCKALYSYTPKLYDELELSPGDVIEVHAKQDDGWWLGALRNQIGIFPATYVEECA
ncbi:hypothetical protein KR093_011217 [Drosophila rubida]|uniref:Nostrin n=1 Tax=Drosophila rubida TaxID=30044 RepID=A0AAD4KBT6_9MUSC|nr:hypothetical protein KR093_011217 [Drosophila rubida]